MKRGLILLILIFSAALAPPCFAQTQTLTAEIRNQTIDDLSALLPERYAYKELGPRLREVLQNNLRTGKYDSYTSPMDFSIAVTNDLRSLNSDRHLALNYDPQAPPTNTNAGTPQPTPSAEERAKRASAFNRQMNYGFKQVQFLNGNVGYLKFDYFDAYLDYSSAVVDSAMAFLKNCDALIIDLRDNGGGGSQMVGYIAGFFFPERTLSGSSYNRLDDKTTEEFIAPQPKEKQFGNVDLYILTSRSTVSAAEALAYTLKYLRKAVVIGETSAGAANPGRVTRINNLFTAFIPNRHGKNVVTGTNWEGTGVPVDIAHPAEDALRIARITALTKLQRNATDPLQKRRFGSYLTYLESTYPEKELPGKILGEYVGEYQGRRTISLKDRKLYYARVAETGGQLHPISKDVFMLSEGDVTITFKRDKQGRVIEMESQWSLSERPTLAKKVKS